MVGRVLIGLAVLALEAALTYALAQPWMLFSMRRWPWVLILASVGACLATLVFFVWYPSVVPGIFLDLAVLGALVWAYRPRVGKDPLEDRR